MDAKIRKRLCMQGFKENDIASCKGINMLARWTPFACAVCGTIGLLIGSSYYFFALAALTLIGALGPSSFYDYIYNFIISSVLRTEKIPKHGAARRFGCFLGSVFYLLSGIGFYIHNSLLAYIPASALVILALVAAFTHWCFASSIYGFIFGKEGCCC